MNRVLSQQQQIDELRARLEALENQSEWRSVDSAAQFLGISPSSIRNRIKLRAYKKTWRRVGRNYKIHVALFQKQLDKESYKFSPCFKDKNNLYVDEVNEKHAQIQNAIISAVTEQPINIQGLEDRLDFKQSEIELHIRLLVEDGILQRECGGVFSLAPI